MGTSKSGRYLNTKGSGRSVSDFALVHSSEGTFKWKLVKKDGKKGKKIRLASGGHSQHGMDLLNKYGIEYHIVKTYTNGVRVGYIPDHADKKKRSGTGQAWFPKDWNNRDIRHAGEHVAGLKHNHHSPDGVTMWGVYKGVHVGVKKTNGKISTVFPDSDQSSVLRRKKK